MSLQEQSRAAREEGQSLNERRAELLVRLRRESHGSLEKPNHQQYHTIETVARSPLIEKVTNSWRDVTQNVDDTRNDEHERHLDCCDLEDGESLLSAISRLISSKRFRRTLMIMLALLLSCYYVWTSRLQPQMLESQKIKDGFTAGKFDGSYGIARGGDFQGTRVRALDLHLVPGGVHDEAGARRLVFIGDIHGCLRELQKLLKKINFDEKLDHLIAAGDVVTKGPDSIAVLDELIRLNATTVRGNHEDRLIVAAKDGRNSDCGHHAQASTTSKGAAKDHALLCKMKAHHITYLQDMPLMLRVPALPQVIKPHISGHHIANEIMVVHAGLVPHVPLAKQDPYFVMNMRSIDHRTHVPSATRAGKSGRGKPWYQIWNWYNDRVSHDSSISDFIRLDDDDDDDDHREPAAATATDGWLNELFKAMSGKSHHTNKPQVVIYGHDSKAGLQLHNWSRGLDSGCVSGGALTALVLDARGKQSIKSVKCKDYRA